MEYIDNRQFINQINEIYKKHQEHYMKPLTCIDNLENKLMETNIEYEVGRYYYNIEKTYERAIKYFMLAIKKGNTDAMYSLGHYYSTIKIDYDKAKIYFITATEKDHVYAMFSLAYYYDYIENNNWKAKKYYFMATNKTNIGTNSSNLL